ncbi:helix-turn-helix transcriptional regulator [Streptomyces sp. W16]|uniref:helix-turn-helix domain-containing protein n=1 Tax=Streptomyces sp. W16 TaxID=3076631 RepID=UPI00295C1F1D|nr:helix-turn-helix transcriptional regulator [Streptomyces sp. W16]MDV9170945.1 helix-turn-helix transcriptional regulator [Streptomyces sp. W16]
MDHTENAADPVATISARVKELRTRKGWTGADLGRQMTARGIRWDRSIVANLENGRRATVSVSELLALARVFDVAPVHLLVPVQEQPFRVAEDEVYPARRVRAWIRGESPLPGTDERIFRSEVPLDELGRLTVEGQSRRDRMRAEYRAATGREIGDDALLNWMTGYETPKELDDGEQEHREAPER